MSAENPLLVPAVRAKFDTLKLQNGTQAAIETTETMDGDIPTEVETVVLSGDGWQAEKRTFRQRQLGEIYTVVPLEQIIFTREHRSFSVVTLGGVDGEKVTPNTFYSINEDGGKKGESYTFNPEEGVGTIYDQARSAAAQEILAEIEDRVAV